MTRPSPKKRAGTAQRPSVIGSRVAAFQVRTAWLVLVVGLGVAVAAGLAARRLTVRSGLESLLGPRVAAVRSLKTQRTKLPSGASIAVAVEGKAPSAVERFTGELVAALRGLPTDLVREVRSGTDEERALALRHPFLYADVPEARALRDALHDRLDRARLRENPFAPAAKAPPAKLPDLAANVASRTPSAFVSADGLLRAVVVRAAADADPGRLLRAVEDAVKRLAPLRRAPAVWVTVTGEPVDARASDAAIARDVRRALLLAGGVALLVLYLFFLRLRPLVLLLGALAITSAWTLGVTYVVLGSLGTATALLVPVVLFHGLTDSISFLGRYLEERREGASVKQALAETQTGVVPATLTATGASIAAYAVLAFADVRAYRDFGLLGVIGMTTAWIVAHGVLPSFIVAMEKVWPFARRGAVPPRAFYGAPFAWLAARSPRALAWGGVLFFLAAGGASARWLLSGPIETDVTRLGPRSRAVPAAAISDQLDAVFRGNGPSAFDVATRSVEEAEALAQKLSRMRLGGTDTPLLGPVRTAASFLPDRQDEKLALYAETREIAGSLALLGSAEERRGVVEALPPENLAPLGLRDLPPELSARFEDREGRLGVVVEVGRGDGPGRSMRSATYLSDVAARVHDLRLPGVGAVTASGTPLLVAATFEALRSEAPTLIWTCLGAVVLVTLFAFRRGRLALVAAGTLLGGIATMLAVAALRGERLQPLSVLALPVTFGAGADYAVSLVRRYAEEGSRKTGPFVRETGAVLVVASGTTLSPYLGLLWADHQTLAAFGRLALYGEIACLGAALLVLPALLFTVPRRTLLPPERKS